MHVRKAGGIARVKVLAAVGGILVLRAGMWWTPQPVQAHPEYLTGFLNTYPNASSTKLNSCALCHHSGADANPYGSDFWNTGPPDFVSPSVPPATHYQAIEQLDSDGDGQKNIDEINCISYPGDPADVCAVGSISGTATVIGNESDPNTNNNTATATVTLSP